MMKHVAAVAFFGTLVAGAATASASDDTPLAKMVTTVMDILESHVAKPSWTSTTSQMKENNPAPEQCYAALKASGVKPDDRVYSDRAWAFPNAQKDGDKHFVLARDVEAMCKRYDDFYVHEYVEAAVVEAWQQQSVMARPVAGMYESEARRVGIAGRVCAEWVDKALAYGLRPTDNVESSRYSMPTVTLGLAKATYCQPAIDFEAKRVAEITNIGAAKHQAIVDVYKKAGIKGKRLELFVDAGMPDDSGFYGPGCGAMVDTVAGLKKAKKLFVWLEGAQGYTVRKYTFKGDNYTVSERTYTTQEGAYAGCR